MWLLLEHPETDELAAGVAVHDENGRVLACASTAQELIPWLIEQGQTRVAIQNTSCPEVVGILDWDKDAWISPAPANANDSPGQRLNGDPSAGLGVELRPPRRFCGDRPLPFVRASSWWPGHRR